MQQVPGDLEVLLAEHSALRDEILRRADHRITLLVGSLTVSAALLGVGVERKSAPILLVLPLFAALFGLLIGYHHVAIRELGSYIKEDLEPLLAKRSGLGDSWTGWQGTRSGAAQRFRRIRIVWHLPVMLVVMLPGLIALFLPWLAFSSHERGDSRLLAPLVVIDIAALAFFVVTYVAEVTGKASVAGSNR